MLQLTKRQIWFLAIALATLVLFTLLAAPNSGTLRRSSSTYGRSPDGYGAWYAYMQTEGYPVQRWQKPLEQLFRDPSQPITLLRVGNGIEVIDQVDQAWIERGNVLVLLGMRTAVTQAPFSTLLNHPLGQIQIDTSRRNSLNEGSKQPLLSDAYGAVVWQETKGKGRVIYCTTPHLAANAYQDTPGNFAFLKELVTAANYPIWVDEYLHGYKDADVVKQEGKGNAIVYLARTPLSLLAIQAAVILLVLVWGHNQRLGLPMALTEPTVDNSAAYIQAMASVLHKAECSEFVVEMIGKAEQLALQQALGLGAILLPIETVVAAWVQQTGRSAAELETVLETSRKPRRISETELLKWLEAIQTAHRF